MLDAHALQRALDKLKMAETEIEGALKTGHVGAGWGNTTLALSCARATIGSVEAALRDLT
jgi:hypothetical protein